MFWYLINIEWTMGVVFPLHTNQLSSSMKEKGREEIDRTCARVVRFYVFKEGATSMIGLAQQSCIHFCRHLVARAPRHEIQWKVSLFTTAMVECTLIRATPSCFGLSTNRQEMDETE